MSASELARHVALIYYLCLSPAHHWVMWYPLPLSLCSVRFFALSTVTRITTPTALIFSLFLCCNAMNNVSMMDAESEKRSASTISFSSSSSNSSSSCHRLDRLVDAEEIQAAETLAQLAMRDSHSADKWCTKQDTTRVTRESPTLLHSDLSLGPGVRFPFTILLSFIYSHNFSPISTSLSQIVPNLIH